MLHNEFMEIGFYIMFYPIVAFYGICIGSFLNVVIFRLPNNESLIKRSSHCMSCGTKIRKRDLVPIFSWLFLKGKCHNCGEKISPRYPIVEALNGIVYIITFTVLDFSIESIIYCLFFSILICIGFIDFDTMEMDLRLLILILLLAVPCAFVSETVTLPSRIIGFFCIGLPFLIIGEIVAIYMNKKTGERIRGIELGDTILMAVSGALIGWKAVCASAFFGILIAAIFGIINKYRSGESKLAFGPYLAIGLFIGTLFGDSLIDWYIAMLTYDPYAV
ncbi:MAG: prepilin peptidase [Ruminococcus sp.]|nr:prepilin peptidase [Ruminococcus sp.]